MTDEQTHPEGKTVDPTHRCPKCGKIPCAQKQRGYTDILKYDALTGLWHGWWQGHLVKIVDVLVRDIRERQNGEALLVGPDMGMEGVWIATTLPDGWLEVPSVRVWYRYEDFVEYVRMT